MLQSPPLVSVGVPVYNEARFIEESLGSVLAQDYGNLEIIISDNASTDATGEICRAFSQRDKRIRYERVDENRGATTNFKRVMELAQGKYFMWASGHDLWSPNLLSQCVALLESEPEAVIAFASGTWIDATGQGLAKVFGWTDTRGMDPVARFFAVFWGNMHPILGVIRTDVLRQTRFLSCAGTDLIVLSELALIGHFVHAPAASWSRREIRGPETHQLRMKRYRSRQYGLSSSWLDLVFPVLRLPLELIKVVLRSRASWFEKLGILLILFPSLPVKYVIGRRARAVVAQNSSRSKPRY
jgi:glycosyltransferase involved in cell wall biosynthesis